MPSEIEAKFAVSSHDAVRAGLVQHGARRIGRVIETNSFFDRVAPSGAASATGQLARAGAGLRVRSLEALEGHAAPATITLKGPVESSAFKRREELEVPVADADGMRQLLAGLGFTEILRFRKRRESWTLGGCHVELDELPRLGCFVEIEGPDEAAIELVRAMLALNDAVPIKESYAALLASAVHAGPNGGIIDFPS